MSREPQKEQLGTNPRVDLYTSQPARIIQAVSPYTKCSLAQADIMSSAYKGISMKAAVAC